MEHKENLLNHYYHLLSLTQLHHFQNEESIDLCPSNSWVSALARLCLGSSLSNTYHIGVDGTKLNSGASYIDMIERDVKLKLTELFGYKYCFCQFLSGMQATSALFQAILESGDVVFSLPCHTGGHYSHHLNGSLQNLNVSVVSMPTYDNSPILNLDKLEELLKKYKPKLLVIGSNQPLFHVNLEQIYSLTRQSNTKILYDISQVAGLIAGKQFQHDLNQYADYAVSSTSKSLHAPNHGILMSKEAFKDKDIIHRVTANTHPQELASLGIVLTEWIAFGKRYASDLINFNQDFILMLEQAGFRLAYNHLGTSESHLVILQVSNPEHILSLLNKAGIYATMAILPQDKNKDNVSGICLATHILLRRGFTKQGLQVVVDALKDIIILGKDPRWVRLHRCYSLAQTFNSCLYSFDSELKQSPDLFSHINYLKNQSSIMELAATIPALSSLSVSKLGILAGRFVKSIFQKRCVIFNQNDISDAVYFVLDGEVHIFETSQDEPILVGKVLPGSHFGELGVISGCERSYEAQAMPKTLCLVLDKESFMEILEGNKELINYFTNFIKDLQDKNVDII